jgi:DNA processing protein
MDREALAALVLQSIKGLGLSELLVLLEVCGSLEHILQTDLQTLHRISKKASSLLARYQQYPDKNENDAYTVVERCVQAGVTLLPITHDRYPALLKETARPPLLLFVRGDVELLNLPQIAIVGSRNASRSGLDSAREFARALAAGGFVVTSGLALGIDAAAHSGALEQGKTIGVIGCGIDRCYPRRNESLYRQIEAAGGVVVSEFLPGTPPLAQNFPRRNRIISGMSTGVLVIEAALKSGSLITARQAMEENREVFAMPGSIHNPLARGCHQLIKQGATLVESTSDIVEQLGGALAHFQSVANEGVADCPVSLSDEEQRMLEAIGYDPIDMDALVAVTGLSVVDINRQLLVLELAGLIENRAGSFVRIC